MTLQEKVAKEIRDCFSSYVEGNMMWKDWPEYAAHHVLVLLDEECKELKKSRDEAVKKAYMISLLVKDLQEARDGWQANCEAHTRYEIQNFERAMDAEEKVKEARKMVVQAHEACKSESMFCPWCSGHIAPDEEWHDELCPWGLNEFEFIGRVE